MVSHMINPVVSGFLAAGIFAFQLTTDPFSTFKWLGLTFAITSIPTIGYVLYLVETGHLRDFHMPDRADRIKPLFIISCWIVISTAMLIWIQAPPIIILVLVVATVQVILLSIITMVWKISFHSAIIMTAAVVSILLKSNSAWFISGLVPLVGWSRVLLRRHTISQVIGGYLAGMCVASLALYGIGLYLTQ